MSARDTLKQVPWHMWFGAAALVAAPFYVWPSGGPQPADFMIALFVAITLVRHRARLTFPSSTQLWVSLMVALVVWIFHVNLAWAWYFSKPRIFLNAVFYLYNCVIAMVFVALFHEYGTRLHRGLVNTLFFTLVLILAISPMLIDFNGPNGFRQSLVFNNPNQLGYYAVLCASIFLAVSQRVNYSATFQALFYGAAGMLILLSVSRAGAGASLLIAVVAARHRPRILAGLSLLLSIGVGVLFSMPEFSERLLSRLSDPNANVNRGYHRIWENPGYLFFGAGESTNVELFGLHHELHSNLGTMLFSYGLVGFGLYVALHLEVMRRAPLRMLGSLLPPAILGLAHQGLRFPLYWVHLVVLLTLWSVDRPARAVTRESRRAAA